MLFLIGTKDSNVKNGILLNEKCPKCETADSLHFSIYKRYTHVTLIPLFPVGKSVFINCIHCGENFDYEDLPESAQFKLKNEKVKNSLWMFTGSIILVFFLIFTINNYFNDNEETDRLIKNPIEGDIYNLKFSNGYYSNMRIDKVNNDSIYTTHNNFDAYMPYEIDDLDKSQNYTNKKVNYSRKDILKLYDEGDIIKVRRKLNNLNLSN
jgi:hypothetical protein